MTPDHTEEPVPAAAPARGWIAKRRCGSVEDRIRTAAFVDNATLPEAVSLLDCLRATAAHLWSRTMEEAVVRALVECLDFIANSPDDVIEPDAAVRALESVSYALRALAPDAQVALSHRILDLAEDTTDPRASFVRSLPDAIGLASR